MSLARPSAMPTVQVDNERVRVTEWRFEPGAATGWHRHEHDYVVVPLTTGRLMLEEPGGGSRHPELTAGGSYFKRAGVEQLARQGLDGIALRRKGPAAQPIHQPIAPRIRRAVIDGRILASNGVQQAGAEVVDERCQRQLGRFRKDEGRREVGMRALHGGLLQKAETEPMRVRVPAWV